MFFEYIIRSEFVAAGFKPGEIVKLNDLYEMFKFCRHIWE